MRVPNAAKLADPNRVYRVVFDARRGAEKPDQLVPAINMAGSEINTLAALRLIECMNDGYAPLRF